MKLFIGMCLIIVGIGLIYLHIFGPTVVYNEEQFYRAVEKNRRKIIVAGSFDITKSIEIPKNITLVIQPGVQIGMGNDCECQLILHFPQSLNCP